jgi:predicted metalloendopeptidase
MLPPQVVNAYYNPFFNEIVFPAAILQPPFYNYQVDAAVNYGGIGAVIGHEMSHGFDDMGSRFDAEGNLKNWWTDSDRERFEDRTKLLIEQFDAYEPLEGINLNGEFTLGENIGDLGGLNIAYDGLQRYILKHGDPGLIDGYTQDQRFFISWGTIWRTKMRDEALKTRIQTDPHAPGMYRAIAPQSNMASFYAAFNVNEDDTMYRPEEVSLEDINHDDGSLHRLKYIFYPYRIRSRAGFMQLFHNFKVY